MSFEGNTEQQPDEEFQEEIQRALGPNLAFHWTIMRPDYHETTVGLYETEADAKKAIETYAESELTVFYGAGLGEMLQLESEKAGRQIGLSELRGLRAANWRASKTRNIKVNKKYNPWGTGGGTFTHGIDDGTHGSVDKRTVKDTPRERHF